MSKNKAMLLLAASILFLMSCQVQRPEVRLPEPVARDSGQPSGNLKILLVTGDYIPFTSQALPGNGFFSEIVTQALQDMGVAYELRFFPWARCEDMVKTGEAWAAFPYGFSERIAAAYHMSDAIFPSHHRFFYLKANKKLGDEVQHFRDIAEFRKYTFGGSNGYWYGSKDDLLELGFENVEWADDIDGLVKMLYNKRIDVLIEDELVGWETIKRLYPEEEDRFATLQQEAKAREYFLIVSRTYPRSLELLEKFNVSLRRLKKNGTPEALMKKRLKGQ